MMTRLSSSRRTAAISIVAIGLIAPPARIVASSSNPALNKTAATSALECLVQARATATPQGVLIEWTTGLDMSSLGFNVYRITNGQRTKLNLSLIAGSALVVKARTQSYAWMDPAGASDSQYEVESVDLRGDSSNRVVAQSNWSAALPEYRQSELLSKLGGRSAVTTMNPESLGMDQSERSLPAAPGDLTTKHSRSSG